MKVINQQKGRAIHQQTQDLLIARVSKIQTESALVNMATVFASSGCTIYQASNVMFCSLAFTHSYWQNSKHSVCIFISAIAETHKNAGNDAFSKHDFVKAINLYTEGIEVKSKDEDLNAKLYNNRASAHYHLGKVSFILYLLNALSTLHVVSYPTFYCLFCIFAHLRKDTPGIPIQLSLLALLMLSG